MIDIATRESVQILAGDEDSTKKQTALIENLLRDFPDSTELFEYEDYLRTPSRANASAYITATLDMNAHSITETDGYMKYISMRPGVEKHGEHGLFGDAPCNV